MISEGSKTGTLSGLHSFTQYREPSPCLSFVWITSGGVRSEDTPSHPWVRRRVMNTVHFSAPSRSVPRHRSGTHRNRCGPDRYDSPRGLSTTSEGREGVHCCTLPQPTKISRNHHTNDNNNSNSRPFLSFVSNLF